MQLEHGRFAELGGEEEAKVPVLGVHADVDDAAPAPAVAVPVGAVDGPSGFNKSTKDFPTLSQSGLQS